LTVDNSFLTAFSKTFEGKTTETEQWYGTAYTVKPIPSTTLSRWKNPGTFPLFYPRKNVFIPSESGLKVNKTPKTVGQAQSFEDKMKPIPPPTIIRDDGDEGRWTVYFKEDDRFGKPKAFLIFQLLTDELYSSPTKAVLGMLYQQCAGDKMNEDTVRTQNLPRDYLTCTWYSPHLC
jgi:secreted Zn-dependent insulinase-like peptidase